MPPFLALMLLVIGAEPPTKEPVTAPFEAPKHGLKTAIPKAWTIAEREKSERIFVAVIPQADPGRPGVAACELGLAPESLDEYRTRIEGNARRGRRPGSKLAKNDVLRAAKGDRLETIWEFRPADGVLWREVSVRVIAHKQMYTFILNVDDPTYEKVRPAFDALVDATELTPPNTGADLFDKGRNRWVQREFKFAIDLPDDWGPVLAPSSVALLFANGPASGVWSDNLLVLAKPSEKIDLDDLVKEFPEQLQREEPGCELISCKLTQQGDRDALETIVRTQRGPFSMTVIERRFRGIRFDYEVKYTIESKRFDTLLPLLRKSFESFEELPGSVPSALPRKSA